MSDEKSRSEELYDAIVEALDPGGCAFAPGCDSMGVIDGTVDFRKAAEILAGKWGLPKPDVEGNA